MNRRDFLIKTALLTGGGLLLDNCSYMPPKDEIDKKNQEIGLYEEWLMGLIAIRNTKTPLYNPSGTLNPTERRFQLMLKKLHYNAANFVFWRETYKPPELILYRSRAKGAFTLPGGFIGVTTGMINFIYNGSKQPDRVLAAILSHELVHLYLEHPKRHYVTMLLKDNLARQYREMAEGIQAATGDFQSDFNKMIIKTILKAKQAGIEGYEAEMEFEADTKGVLIMNKSGYRPKGMIEALTLVKHHMGGIHGTYEQRTARVRQALKKI